MRVAALAVLGFLEDHYLEMTDAARDVIDVSFLENLADNRAVTKLLGPVLRREYLTIWPTEKEWLERNGVTSPRPPNRDE